MGSYGTTVLSTTGNPIQVSADGCPIWKSSGITIDWTTVTAVSVDTTLADGTVVKNGDKYLRYGTILDVITSSGLYGEVDTTVTDGREAMGRGETYVLNETVLESELGSDHAAVFEGGLVYEARLKVGGSGEATLANLKTALPSLLFKKDENP